jgi:hypothetical protein
MGSVCGVANARAADASLKNFPASDTGTIVCVQCRVEKSVLEFYANKRTPEKRTSEAL